MSRPPISSRPRRSGFTLIETLAVVIGLSLVLTAVFSTFSTVQQQATVAAQATEGPRRATAVLDRMARELASTVLVVKPDTTDPLDHPWLFLAESHGAFAGADRVRFQTRSHRPQASEGHASDLLDVAWFLAPADDGIGQELHYWSSPQLSPDRDQQFPRSDAAGVRVWARDIAEFGIRWLAEDGGWVAEWDSSTVLRSSQVPMAAEITIAFLGADEEQPVIPFTRRVNLALRPIDLEADLRTGEESEAPEADEAGDEDDELELEGLLPGEEA